MNRKIVIAVVVLLLIVFCCICTGIAAYLGGKDQEAMAPLALACDGRPVPGARAYVRGAPPRSAYFYRSTGSWFASMLNVPAPQRAEGPSDAALVMCQSEPVQRVAIDTCCFERTLVGVGVPGTETCFPRVQMRQKVAVRVAQTGALLAEWEVYGPEPPTCGDWVGRTPHAGDFEGDDPDEEQLAPFFSDPSQPVVVGPATPMVPVAPPDALDGSMPVKK